MTLPSPALPKKLPNTITPEQEKQAIALVKNQMSIHDNRLRTFSGRIALALASWMTKILQNPIVARVACAIANRFSPTPLEPKQIIIGAKIAQKAVDEKREELGHTSNVKR